MIVKPSCSVSISVIPASGGGGLPMAANLHAPLYAWSRDAQISEACLVLSAEKGFFFRQVSRRVDERNA